MEKINNWSATNNGMKFTFMSNDLERCSALLDKENAPYFTRETTLEDGSTGTELISYSPYYKYDSEHNILDISCYVYNWCDTYDKDGNFLKHEVYECTYSTELDKDI